MDIFKSAGYVVHANDIANGGEDFLTMDIPDTISFVVTNPPFSKKRLFVSKIILSGKFYALLLPTSTLQSKGLFTLLQTFGCTVLILNPPPPFLVNGKKKNVVDCSWFIGNGPNNKPGVVETIYLNLAPSSLIRVPSDYKDVMSTQASQDYMAWGDDESSTPKTPKTEEITVGVTIDEVVSSGLICDKCVQPVSDEDGFAGVCKGELCKDQDVHLCRHCAHTADESLLNLYCMDCLKDEYEGDDFSPPATYADIVTEEIAKSPRADMKVSDA